MCIEIWAGAQLEPVFWRFSDAVQIFKFGLWLGGLKLYDKLSLFVVIFDALRVDKVYKEACTIYNATLN